MKKTVTRRRWVSRWGLLLGGGAVFLLAAVVAWSLVTTAGTAPSLGSGLAPRAMAPPLRLATMDGTFDLAAQRGSVVLFVFAFVG